jgi:hypothetical protein
METRKLLVSAMVVAGLALAACGDGERTDVTLPSDITRPERTTTAPSEPESPATPEEPDTGGPTTETPTTETPTTETPTTETPTTETPTTETPTTRSPATRPPTTETPTTETPTTEIPSATDPVVDSEAADDSAPWWPWLLAALAIVGVVVFLASRKSRRAAAWKQQTGAALDDATRLATHLAAVSPEGAAMVAAQDAPQLAALAATLSTRETETTDPAARRAIASVRGQVQALHGVVDGIAMTAGAASPAALGYLKEQAMALHGAAARARAELFPPPPVPAAAGQGTGSSGP